MISDWTLLCFSYDQHNNKVLEKGSFEDFGHKVVLYKSRVDPQLVKESCLTFINAFSLVFH